MALPELPSPQARGRGEVVWFRVSGFRFKAAVPNSPFGGGWGEVVWGLIQAVNYLFIICETVQLSVSKLIFNLTYKNDEQKI